MTKDFAFFEATVSRTSLGLPDLDLNDRIAYKTGEQIFGGQQTWNRQTVRSPYVDGEFLVNANRGLVTETFAVDVLGTSQAGLQANLGTLIDAFSQPSYTLSVSMEDGVHAYFCQPADYSLDWSRERWMARQVRITFSVPRLPVLRNALT